MPFRNNVKYITVLGRLNLLTNLRLCLDVGDSASYNGSDTSWRDVSGNAYDFFLGTTSAVAADDPTFTGTAGDLKDTTYWSFDAGDFFTTSISAPNPTWVENIHKDGAIVTLATWVYLPSLGNTQGLFGNDAGGNVGSIGFFWVINSSNLQLVQFDDGTGGSQSSSTATAQVGWNFFAWSWDENAGSNNISFNTNGVTDTFSRSLPTPSAAAADQPVQIGALGNGVFKLTNGCRMGSFMGWNRKLSTAEMLLLYQYPPGVASDTSSFQTTKKMIGY